MRWLITGALISSLLVNCCSTAAAQSALTPELRAAIEKIDALAASEYGKDKLGGLTVGLIYDSRLVWTKSYGYADAEKRLAATKETVYRIGSISKMFTALMLLQLVEAGRVHLSDPVEKFFPEVNKVQGRFPNAPPITLVQLATHTSGLATEPENLSSFLRGPVADWEKVLIKALPQTKYAYEPGTRYNYSNIGYAILGAALGRAARQPFTDYVTRRILAPLGMTSSVFESSRQTNPRLAKGYAVNEGQVDTETPELEHRGRGYKVPNGALYSTVEDMARFAAFELSEGPTAVLGRDALSDSFERGARMNPALTTGYGLGFEVFRRGDVVMFGHGGSVAGYTSGLLFDRNTRTGVIVLRNVSGGAFNIGGLCTTAMELLARSARR